MLIIWRFKFKIFSKHIIDFVHFKFVDTTDHISSCDHMIRESSWSFLCASVGLTLHLGITPQRFCVTLRASMCVCVCMCVCKLKRWTDRKKRWLWIPASQHSLHVVCEWERERGEGFPLLSPIREAPKVHCLQKVTKSQSSSHVRWKV